MPPPSQSVIPILLSKIFVQMKYLLGVLKNIIFITLPTFLLLLILSEIFFRVIIPSNDPPKSFFDEQEKMYTYDSSEKEGMITIGKFAQLRSDWHVNNMGWNYPIDYYPVQDKKLIVVIGDSFIEAFQVNTDENYPFLLREKLQPDYEVYAFGKSGAALSQYLHISRYVNRHFDPDILIFNIVHNDFDESIHELSPSRNYFLKLTMEEEGRIRETTPRPNYSSAQYQLWKRIIFKSALFRYLYFNLKIVAFRQNINENKIEANIQTDNVIQNKEMIRKATNYLVKKICVENAGKRIIFIFDAPRSAIYDNALQESKVIWLHDMMARACEKNKAEYIDLTPLMQDDYRTNATKFNSDLDGHWNEYGHRFVANVLYHYLNGSQN